MKGHIVCLLGLSGSLFLAIAPNALAQPVTYWYRLSDLVEAIGTGEVQFGCQIKGEFVGSHTSRATKVGLNSPVCLRVQSDVGNGLRVREEPIISRLR